MGVYARGFQDCIVTTAAERSRIPDMSTCPLPQHRRVMRLMAKLNNQEPEQIHPNDISYGGFRSRRSSLWSTQYLFGLFLPISRELLFIFTMLFVYHWGIVSLLKLVNNVRILIGLHYSPLYSN